MEIQTVDSIPEYMAPEILMGDSYTTESSTAWNLGQLIYELLDGLVCIR